MVDLSHILGTDKLLSEVVSLLEKEKNCAIQITAPAGRGKSWIADKIEEYLSLQSIACIHLFGNKEFSNEPYYPFKRFIEKKDKKYNKGLKAFKETIGEIPYLGKGIKVIVDDYNFRKEKLRKTIDEVEPFKKHIPFALHLTGLLRKYENVIIIADDIDHFDRETIDFISRLYEGLMDIEISKSISIISLATEEFPFSFGVSKKILLILPVLTKEQVRRVLSIWSEKEVSISDSEVVFSCTGGHLQLIKIASHYIKETESIEITRNFKDLLVWIVESRLKSVRHQYEKLKNLIISVSKAGKASSSSELICILDNDKDTRDLIQQCVQMDLLVIRDGYIHLSHPIVEEYVLSLRNRHSLDFYCKLAECLKKLNPYDYARRAAIEILAGRTEIADVYWGLAAIQRFQQGSIPAGLSLGEQLSDSPEAEEIRYALNQFAICYAYSIQGLIDEAILEAESITNTLPQLILAERYYLKCLNLAKRISNNAKEEALAIVADWEELKESEPELWYRFSQIKIIASAELGKLDVALKTEAAIIKYYSARLTVDIHARRVLERLSLFSEVLYSPEIAHKKMLLAEEKLTKLFLKEQYDQIVDLYISRTNLSSNSFMIDDFEKSLGYAGSAVNILKEFPEVRFPYPEAPLNNLYLSLLFSDRSQFQYVTDSFAKLIETVTHQENRILVTINFAGLKLLSNEPGKALTILQQGDYIPQPDHDDWYYCYYYWINYALACFLTGNKGDAISAVNILENAPANVSSFLEKYYTMHYQLIKEIVNSSSFTTYEQVAEFISKKKPYYSSNIWERFKVGYLFTDIQIWTSS